MTQKQRVLQELREAGERGICITDMSTIDWTCVLTMRNRVSELRRAGVPIESERCTRHAHRASVSVYRLAPVGQQAMAL